MSPLRLQIRIKSTIFSSSAVRQGFYFQCVIGQVDVATLLYFWCICVHAGLSMRVFYVCSVHVCILGEKDRERMGERC
ncbi:hypothetical protein NP493_842g00023 [Ridgeia piscesae]|uniref:Uncharacterized protein n=1 Tax=Ridgeia piscesae TaxID=27915 RepID=A0AAD9KLS5_RIDPI|nr:hypothetical protein NP493_842g00023 [Ridgeia piscesae]